MPPRKYPRQILLCMSCLIAFAMVGCNRIDPNSPEGRFSRSFMPQLRAQFDGKPISTQEEYAIQDLKKIETTDEGYVFFIAVDHARIDKYSYTWFITVNYDGQAWSLIDGDMQSLNHKSGATQRFRLEGSATGAAVWDRIRAAFNAASESFEP